MTTRMWTMVAGVAFAVALVLGLAPAALAQGPVGEPGSCPGVGPCGGGARLGGPDSSLVAIAAEQLGMTRAELIAELQDGGSIADVASARGVELATIVDAFVATRGERLQAAVDAGRITQAEAGARLAVVRENAENRLQAEWTPRGPGMGAGMRGNGRGGGPRGGGACDGTGPGAMNGR